MSTTTAPVPRQFRTTTDVARELACSTRTIHYLIANEGLPALRLGRSFRIPVEGLRRWMESRQTARPRSDEASAPSAPTECEGGAR